MLSRKQLKDLVRARRKPIYYPCGMLKADQIAELMSFWTNHNHSDILTLSLANRKRHNLSADNDQSLSQCYSQIALQTCKPGGDPKRKQDYTSPEHPALLTALEGLIGPSYRARISCLEPGGKLDEHIDDPQQIRVIALLAGRHDIRIRTDRGRASLTMVPGELWFLNTAWPHAVENTGSEPRLALLLDQFEYPAEISLPRLREVRAC